MPLRWWRSSRRRFYFMPPGWWRSSWRRYSPGATPTSRLREWACSCSIYCTPIRADSNWAWHRENTNTSRFTFSTTPTSHHSFINGSQNVKYGYSPSSPTPFSIILGQLSLYPGCVQMSLLDAKSRPYISSPPRSMNTARHNRVTRL